MIENHELREDLLHLISPDQINYTNPRVGDLVKNVADAINYLFASLYPNYIGTFANPALLPVTASANDYAYVTDDGDGHSAGYVFTSIDGVSAWQKKYDVDWSRDALLSSFISEIHPLYLALSGRENGQEITGGISGGESLTLNANSFDGSGKIITKNTFEPVVDNSLDLGSLAKQFKDIFFSGVIGDGFIALSAADLKAAFDHISRVDNPHSVEYDQLINKLGTLTLGGDANGSVNLNTSGNKTLIVEVLDDSHNHTKSSLPNFDFDVYSKVKSILQNNDGISFAANDALETITPTQDDISTSEITDIDSPVADKILAGNPAGTNWSASTLEVELTGDVEGSGLFQSSTGKVSFSTLIEHVLLEKVDGIDLNNLVVNITSGPVAIITMPGHQLETNDQVYIDSRQIGIVTPEIQGNFTVTKIDNDTFSIPFAVTVGGSAHIIPDNAQLMFNSSTKKWEVRREFAELSHSELNGMDLNDDHQQYVRKSGRNGGQVIQGGLGDNEDLTLESTAGAVKGAVKTKDNFLPNADATYSGSWSGLDLGSSSAKFRHLHMKGELKGARIENVTSLPSASGQNLGRTVYHTVEDKLYYDNGIRFKPLSTQNITTIIVSMSNSISLLVDLDSTLDVDKTTNDYVWELFDATTSARFNPTIARTTGRSVTINSEIPLTGTFILKGI